MKYITHSHKFANHIIAGQAEIQDLYKDFAEAIESISEEEIIDHFKANYEGRSKSLSLSINALLDSKLTSRDWVPQSKLFGENDYAKDKRWRLDFAKQTEIIDRSWPGQEIRTLSGIAVEVAFNHGEAIPWNLLKPTLASEMNHLKKETYAGVGIVVAATEELKEVGAFDSAVGSYEKFLTFIRPLSNILVSPIMLIGLEPPKTFFVRLEDRPGNKKVGFIEMI